MPDPGTHPFEALSFDVDTLGCRDPSANGWKMIESRRESRAAA